MTHTKTRRPVRGRRKFSTKRTTRNRRNNKSTIHPSKLVKAAQPMSTQEAYKAKNTFADFNIAPLLKKNIAKKRFKEPSPIQDQAIPEGLKGGDVIGIANTGTGKTIAFAVPMIQKLMTQKQSRAIVMAPTRELAQQILDEVKMLIQGSGINHALLIGGSSMRTQLNDLRRNPQIVIGTPGRIQDHIKQKKLHLTGFNIVVLDEVDRMLDMGFVNDMRNILGKVAPMRQSLFFSATMENGVRKLIDEFTHDPVTISVKKGETNDNVDQNVIVYKTNDEKIEKLHALLTLNRKNKILIFDATKRGVDRLGKALGQRGFRADITHGDKSQGQRKRALASFKSNRTRILVATDVAARGIDVADITHVINYSMPQSYEDYVHRIGRAGRAGRIGYALTFVEKRY